MARARARARVDAGAGTMVGATNGAAAETGAKVGGLGMIQDLRGRFWGWD